RSRDHRDHSRQRRATGGGTTRRDRPAPAPPVAAAVRRRRAGAAVGPQRRDPPPCRLGAGRRSRRARQRARRRSRLVRAPGDAGLFHLCRSLRRHGGGGGGACRSPRIARGALSPPARAAEGARGRQRRRLRGRGLSGGRTAAGHDGGCRAAGGAAARGADQPVRRSGAQPHRRRSPLGAGGARGRPLLPRLLHGCLRRGGRRA
ncbi:hypothetical protein LTR94_031090, partial [Friedmanniomyces endolithicus]